MCNVTGGAKSKISRTTFEKLCKIQCTEEEISEFFGVSHDTIWRWCKETYVDEDGNPMNFDKVARTFSSRGKVKLRKMQMKLAEKSDKMAIWLGKQYLGQTDKIENNNIERVEFVSDVPTVDTIPENYPSNEDEESDD